MSYPPPEPIPDDAPRYAADGTPLYCIDGRRQPCPIHWPDLYARLAEQLTLALPADRPRRR